MISKFVKGTPNEMMQADHQRFFVRDADGFSAERNNFIIEQTIKEYEAMRAKKNKQFDDHYAERADAVVSFIKSVDKGNNNSGNNLEKYFGKKMLAYLRGQQIRDQLMSGMTVKNKDGLILKRGV